MRNIKKTVLVSAILVVGMVLTSASACEKAIDDIMRVLGNTPGTFYNYGADSRGSYTVLDTALLG